jgi:hypothetical protein
MALQPLVDLVGVEAHEVADFVVGDGSFGDHAPHVADARADVVGAASDVEQRTLAAGMVMLGWNGGHVCLPRVLVVGALLADDGAVTDMHCRFVRVRKPARGPPATSNLRMVAFLRVAELGARRALHVGHEPTTGRASRATAPITHRENPRDHPSRRNFTPSMTMTAQLRTEPFQREQLPDTTPPTTTTKDNTIATLSG